MLDGIARDVRGSFGTNTLHIDFEGDGAFLDDAARGAAAPAIVNNAAELSLADGADPQKILEACDRPPAHPQFEVAAPSLEEIFIEKVGRRDAARRWPMNKMLAVLKREYLAAVRKKMFIIMTFLLPVLMSAAILLPSLMMARGLGEKKVAVLDGTGKLRERLHRTIAPTSRTTDGCAAEPRRAAADHRRYVDAHATRTSTTRRSRTSTG